MAAGGVAGGPRRDGAGGGPGGDEGTPGLWVADLAWWREQLACEGIQALDTVPIPGYDRFEFRDPFGNRVEFIKAVGQ